MILDGQPLPTGVYTEISNEHHMPVAVVNHAVQHDGQSLYSHLSPLTQNAFGKPNASGKFTEVAQDGVTVYTEAHPDRKPMT